MDDERKGKIREKDDERRRGRIKEGYAQKTKMIVADAANKTREYLIFPTRPVGAGFIYSRGGEPPTPLQR